MSNLIGKSLGRYHVIQQLGEGGMAVVYKAYDTRLERDVAVKIIRRGAFPPDQLERMLKRFEREAKALAKLSHPNIVGVIDYGEYDGAPYLVMEYLPGGTLKQRVGKPIPWREAVRLLIPVAQALEYAHAQNIIHRDVKPSNILLTVTGQPMLTDFGIAKILESDETLTLTGTGVGIGTPEYMAPEQWTGAASKQSDIYSLGIVLYEMVTGRKPYVADTPAAILLKQTNDPLPRPRAIVPDLPEGVERVLLKTLARNPGDRYESMALFASALEGLLSEAAARREIPADTLAAPRRRADSVTQLEPSASVGRKAAEASIPDSRRGWEPAPVAAANVSKGKGLAGKIPWLVGVAGVLCLLVVCALAGKFALDYFQPAFAPAPTATVMPPRIPNTPTLLPTTPTLTPIPLQMIVGLWSGEHLETFGDKRSFVMELTITATGADTFSATVVLYQNNTVFQTNTAEGDFDGLNVRFADNDGRYYWGSLQNGHLVGQVAWSCYGCDVWGTLDLIKVK